MFPIFRVESTTERDGVLGSVTRTTQGNETWVAEPGSLDFIPKETS